jgi:cell wall-associated NlpC family hydrolase
VQKTASAAAITAAIVAMSIPVAGSSGDVATATPSRAEAAATVVPAPAPAAARTLRIRARHEAMEVGLLASPPPPSPAARRNARAAQIALEYLGTPYSYGGASPAGFDCSGLVRFAFGRVGAALPHSSYALWDAGRRVARRDLRAGDLVFFNGLGHVGIAIGGGRYVHAPRSGEVVEVASLAERDDYLGAVRV